MKAILTGGGRATRLRPITYTWNKHLIPLANKPMIFHAIEKVVEAGITEIAINTNPGETELQKYIGNGSGWGANIHFFEQRGGPLGIANVPKQAEEWLDGSPFLFYLSDNIVLGSIKSFVDGFVNGNFDALMALARVSDPHRFGVPEIVDGKVVRLEEKPAVPKSSYAVTGLYLFSPEFFDAYSTIAPSARGEYEITDIYNWYLANNRNVGYQEITGWWKDTGKPDDLLEANALLLNDRDAGAVSNEGSVHETAVIQGRVSIGKGTVIGAGCLVRGPVSIGSDCVIERSCIGPFTSIGDNARITDAEIDHSIIFCDAAISCKRRLVDALIGKNAIVTSAEDTKPNGHKLIIGDNAVVEL